MHKGKALLTGEEPRREREFKIIYIRRTIRSKHSWMFEAHLTPLRFTDDREHALTYLIPRKNTAKPVPEASTLRGVSHAIRDRLLRLPVPHDQADA